MATRLKKQLNPEKTHHCGKDHCTALQVSTLTRLDLTKKENMLLLVGSETVESKLAKLETSHAVILPPTVSVLW